jgi:hypothetical protein
LGDDIDDGISKPGHANAEQLESCELGAAAKLVVVPEY